MQVDRRTFTAGAMAALAASPAMAQRRAPGGWYDRAIIIDGLGGTGDPYTDEGITRMSDRGWAETVATGVTVIRDTVMPVGNRPIRGPTIKRISQRRRTWSQRTPSGC